MFSPMKKIPEGQVIASQQAAALNAWYANDVVVPEISESDDSMKLVLEQCSRNYQLWNQEDQARRLDVDDAMIATVKRAIDKLNQQRNDLIEKLDEAFLSELEAGMNPDAPQNSETAGSIVDRMAIMGLKCVHMAIAAERQDAGEEHCQLCRSKLEILQQQRGDLARCFDELIAASRDGCRRFMVYRQYKMYNDPTLNPELYRRK
jgi:Protein of unknown function (DUF4254)